MKNLPPSFTIVLMLIVVPLIVFGSAGRYGLWGGTMTSDVY